MSDILGWVGMYVAFSLTVVVVAVIAAGVWAVAGSAFGKEPFASAFRARWQRAWNWLTGRLFRSL